MRRVWPSLRGIGLEPLLGCQQSRSFSTPSANETKGSVKCDPDTKLSYVSYECIDQSQALKPLIMQHALFGGKENIARIGKTINHLTKRAIIIPDARNHGDSPRCTNPSVKQMSTDLICLQSSLQVPQASMLGFSTGGRVTMMAALFAPKMVDRLVVSSASPLNTQHTLEKWERFQEAVHIVHTLLKSRGISSKSEVLDVDINLKLDIDDALKSTLKDKVGRALFLSNLGKSKLKYMMNGDLGRFPNVEEKCFNGHVLFISGERQPSWANDDDIRRIKQIFPNSHFVKIPGAGHWVHLEKMEDFLAAVISFLETEF